MMSLMGLLPSPPAEIVSGQILYGGQDVRKMSEEQVRHLRGGEIGFVFQDPMTSLNRSSPWVTSWSNRSGSIWA